MNVYGRGRAVRTRNIFDFLNVADFRWRWWFRRPWLMVVLVAGDGQHPAADGLAVHSLGPPWAVRLLGMCLVLGSHALVRPAASIAD